MASIADALHGMLSAEALTTLEAVTEPGGVTALNLATSSVTTVKIADDAVTAAKAPVFVSTEQTGTGSSQNVAHGLAVTPTLVMIAVTEHPGTPDTGAFDVEEGTHTSTNVVVTVTANVKFKVLAWA